MFDFLKSASTPPSDLLGIIRYVRARWRARLAVKGAVRAFVVNVGVFFALAYLMQWSRFTPSSIRFARLVLAASIVGSVYFLLVKPLRRKVTDDQVALYLEEKEPSLQTMLISAVESSREGRHWESSALVEKLVAQAIEKCCEADAPRRAEHGPLRVNGADQTINARLSGFSAQNAVIMLRRDPTSKTYEKLPLVLNDKGTFEGIIFGIKSSTE